MRRLEITSATGRDQYYRAFVADEEHVALFAGISGGRGEEGEPIDDVVGQARRAAELVKGLIQQANVEAQPQIVLRVLTSASAEYGEFIDDVGDAIRAALGSPEPAVSVTLAPRLMNESALIEMDAVLAA